MDKKVSHFTKAADFLLALINVQIEEHKQGREILFRGHSSACFELKPTLFRKDAFQIQDYNNVYSGVHSEIVGERVFKQWIRNLIDTLYESLEPEKKQRMTDIVALSLIELRFLTEFLNLSNKANLSVTHLTPITIPPRRTDPVVFYYNFCEDHRIEEYLHYLSSEMKFGYDNFLSDSVLLRDFGSFETSAFSMRALARHHGVPSRLLDFTRHPLVAAYFSVSTHTNPEGEVAVEALTYRKQHEKNIEFNNPIIVHENFLRHGLENLIKQDGVLLEFKHMDEFYYHHGIWPSLYEYIDKIREYRKETGSIFQFNDDEYALQKYQLAGTEANKLRELLNELGYNRQKLMPSYDNVALSVKEYMSSIHSSKEKK